MLAILKARLKELVGELEAITKKTEFTADDFAALKTKNAEVLELEAQIADVTTADATRARAALPANDPALTPERTPAQPVIKLTTSEKVGLMVAAMAKTHLETGARGYAATFKAMDDAGYGAVAKEFAPVQRALNSASASGGGVLVPETMSSEIIDVLRPMTTFLQAGPRRQPLINGNYKVAAAASSASAAWRGEGKAIQKSQPTMKDINMSTKFLDSLVPITNQLIRFSLPDVKAWVEMDMANVMGVEIDSAAYFGSGTVHSPRGITKIDGITRITATAADPLLPTIQELEADASALELSMMNSNLPMLGAAWVMSPRTFIFLQNRRDGNGNRYYPELQNATPTWRNKRVYVTTQVAVNGGVTTDTTEILLVAFGHVMFGDGAGLTFQVSTEATVITNGVAVSAFQNDLTYIKASMEADVDVRYLESVAVLDGVRWGA